jgi:hypothetical protein
VPGEKTSPTQPVPLAPAPFARQRLTEEMLTTRTPEAHTFAVQNFRSFRSDGQFVFLQCGQANGMGLVIAERMIRMNGGPVRAGNTVPRFRWK